MCFKAMWLIMDVPRGLFQNPQKRSEPPMSNNIYKNYYPQYINQMDSSEDRATMDEFTCLRTLGSGYHAKVKLVHNEEGKLFAIKKFKNKEALAVLKNELEIMAKFSHPNLVNLVGIRQECVYKKKNGTTYSCLAIILEYAEGGELFQFLARTGRFSSEICRTLFIQLLDGLEHIHKQGVSHRDIKPENILLDQSFHTKIADFGFSCLSEGKDGSGFLHTSLGTEGYKAPEIYKKNYKGQLTDIFSLGVVLFIMYTGSPPFQKADPRDYYYKMHANKKQEAFWSSHSKRKPAGFYSQSFMNLINRMFAYVPEDRPTISEIRSHEWLQGDILMQPELIAKLTERKETVDNALAEERKAKLERKAQGSVFTGARFRGDDIIDDFDHDLKDQLKLTRKRAIRRLDKHAGPSFEVLDTAQDFMLFLADFTNKVSKAGIELGDIKMGLKGEFKLSDDEMVMHLTFKLKDEQSSSQEQDWQESKLKLQLLKDEKNLSCRCTKQAGSSWHYSQLSKLLYLSYLQS